MGSFRITVLGGLGSVVEECKVLQASRSAARENKQRGSPIRTTLEKKPAAQSPIIFSPTKHFKAIIPKRQVIVPNEPLRQNRTNQIKKVQSTENFSELQVKQNLDKKIDKASRLVLNSMKKLFKLQGQYIEVLSEE